ncbi:MAG: hypothetical protein NUV67_02320 [archaeon]|nr:hypothetical protein [archaeon]
MQLSKISGIEKEEIEQNILFTRTRHGKKLSLTYPIISTPNLASLVAHVFGDGTIGAKKRQFEYANFNKELIKAVEHETKLVFGAPIISRKNKSITFPSIVGDILLEFGAPVAPKNYSRHQIPEWVRQGSLEEKRSFLRALFDDDGSAMFSDGYRSAGVNIAQTRHESRKSELEKLLWDVKILLEQFEIFSGTPKVAKIKKYEDGFHVTMYINVTDFASIKNFYAQIGLTEGTKLETLKKIVARERKSRKADDKKAMNLILSKIKEQRVNSTGALAISLNLNPAYLLKKLKRMEKIGMIGKSGRISANRSFTWKVTEVEHD